jgi:hypothetical protein
MHQTDRDTCGLPDGADDWCAALDYPDRFQCKGPCDRRSHKLSDEEVVSTAREALVYVSVTKAITYQARISSSSLHRFETLTSISLHYATRRCLRTSRT